MLVPAMPVEHPVRLAEEHPETRVSDSGCRKQKVKVYTIPLPVAQERQPGISEGLTRHRGG